MSGWECLNEHVLCLLWIAEQVIRTSDMLSKWLAVSLVHKQTGRKGVCVLSGVFSLNRHSAVFLVRL